jgi:hypothetical protein
MKSYSDFLSEVSASERDSASSILKGTCDHLNGLNSIICSSSNPKDVDLVKEVSIASSDENESLW